MKRMIDEKDLDMVSGGTELILEDRGQIQNEAETELTNVVCGVAKPEEKIGINGSVKPENIFGVNGIAKPENVIGVNGVVTPLEGGISSGTVVTGSGKGRRKIDE